MATINISGVLVYAQGHIQISLDDEQLLGALRDAIADGDLTLDGYDEIAGALGKGVTVTHEMYCDHGPSVYDSYCPKCTA